MTDYSSIEGISEEEQIRLRRQMEELLGDQFNEEDSFREQARDVLEQQNIRNATTVAAQASDLILMDYMRLFYLQQEFEGIAAENLPNVVAYEMAELQGDLDLTEAPAVEAEQEYTGPTIDIAEGPAAVTAASMADAYVERFGGELAEGPLDHSDTVITQADLRDAIEKYESIEITQEEIEAYQQSELQSLIDVRMDGISEDDPDYQEQLESATEWAQDMGMPRESTVIASLRHERFTEEYPEMALSEEQAAAFAADGGPDAELAMVSGDILGYYTDTGTATAMGMNNYLTDRVDLQRELEASNQEAYEQEIADNVAELGSITERVSGLAFVASGDNGSNINIEAFQAKEAEMNAALESGDFNAAINAANEITQTAIFDIESRQIGAIEARFDGLQEAAAEAGYTVETPAQMYELLSDEEAGAGFREAMSNESTFALAFFRGEDGHPYSRLEDTRRQALAMQGDIEMAAARYEGIDLEEVDPAAMTNDAILHAEISAAPALNLADTAMGLLADNDGGARYGLGPAIDHTFGEVDLDRLSMTREIMGFEGMPVFDITTESGMMSMMTALEVYNTGEIPSADRLREIEDAVESGFNNEDAFDLEGVTSQADVERSITAIFAQAHDSTPAIGNIFSTSVVPEGFEERIQAWQAQHPANADHAPAGHEDRTVTAGGLAPGS